MSLIHGSRGIVYFAHEWQPVFREARLLEDEEMADAVARIYAGLRNLAPMLNSVDIVGAMEVASANPEVPVDVLVKQHDGQRYLFAASMREGRTTATFRLVGASAGRVTVLDEGRTIEVVDGLFVDAFVDYDVHLYRWLPAPMTVVADGSASTPLAATPVALRLEQNQPNPFNGATKFRSELPPGDSVAGRGGTFRRWPPRLGLGRPGRTGG
ncbi:MAG: hypothetical protein O2782_06125 [bacterium]|nr:hypothetical protein [bacterium]